MGQTRKKDGVTNAKVLKHKDEIEIRDLIKSPNRTNLVDILMIFLVS